ncbi:MAG: glycosyltransferase family 4 protein [Methylococcales bacterium]|nr:glycosyltransferase family 4 protein [Methylococcales bacterium]
MNNILIFFLASGASWLLTGWFRRYALARQLLDIPNARSSHSLPTPRGGGLAIVIVFLLGLPMLGLTATLAWNVVWAMLGAGVGIAIVGFFDDRGHIAARWRLLAHFCAAAWGLYCLGGMPSLATLGIPLWIGHLLALLYLVWLLNLYNFMDGIDGLASIEALSVCLGGVLLLMLQPNPIADGSALSLLAAAVLGFLVWNFPPAKIFMGDAGSGFLGIVLGLFSIQAASVAPQLFWAWLILLGVFIVDATWTLLHRLVQGEKVYEAHRSHAYQYASRRYGSHKTVTLAVTTINLCWLIPWALWVGLGGLNAGLGLLLAYLPLIALAIYFKAGKRELA